MRRLLLILGLVAGLAGPAQATGLLIPTEKKLPPLAMLNHQVNITIDEQVAVTHIEQTFRNHTSRQLEATYIFPVPKGASVRRFSMWVDGKEVPGELVEADKARKIYTDIVTRTQDPGLLEYMDHNVLKLRVFPVPANGDQKITISYTSVAESDNGLVEFRYPLKTDVKAATTLEKFSINVNLKSQHSIQNIYSPSHAITMTRPNDRQAVIGFEKNQAVLDKDFQLFYTLSTKDVGLNTLVHRPTGGKDGYFMLLISPRAELSKSQQVPRDMVFVLDTSGSMRGKRMEQARKALQYCLENLTEKDRFALINFATTINKYAEHLQQATPENLAAARKWVETLEATGGTAINDALLSALDMRNKDTTRTFTIVFFTDGRPTIGETRPDAIVDNVFKKTSGNTRIFTFGVGDDVNASMLDQLAEKTRAIVSYVREAEEIEAKVSSLYAKISNPVLANLKLAVGDAVKLSEIYPPQLPDLFHGSQLVVLGKYSGSGHVSIKLTGQVGSEAKEFVYETNFPDKSAEDKTFVEDIWARRKVGYLLDQIRINGEKKELVEEVVTLAKRYGITTPYTSYLVVPDGPMPVAKGPGVPRVAFPAIPPALQAAPGAAPAPVVDFIKKAQKNRGEAGEARDKLAEKELDRLAREEAKAGDGKGGGAFQKAVEQLHNYRQAKKDLQSGNLGGVQAGKLGVELSLDANCLRNQTIQSNTAVRRLGNRNALEVGGVWIDETYEAKMKTVNVKAQSSAYFRILERQPSVLNVFRLGNHLVWVTPSNTALVIDASTGEEELSDAAIDALFQPAQEQKK